MSGKSQSLVPQKRTVADLQVNHLVRVGLVIKKQVVVTAAE